MESIWISSVEDLQNMGKYGYYKLVRDIDCEGFDFRSIIEFQGTLDGDGYTIKNLNIKKYGLIGIGENVTIKNLQFDNLKIKSDNCGGLINELSKECKFENVIIKNSTISGNNFVGGFVGTVYTSSVVIYNNCKIVDSKIFAESGYVGGFVGSCKPSFLIFNDCKISDSNIIAGFDSVGGFVGEIICSTSVVINNSVLENIRIIGLYNVGGFIGYVYSSPEKVIVFDSIVSNCEITAGEEFVGSVIGYDGYKNNVISCVSLINNMITLKDKQVDNMIGDKN